MSHVTWTLSCDERCPDSPSSPTKNTCRPAARLSPNIAFTSLAWQPVTCRGVGGGTQLSSYISILVSSQTLLAAPKKLGGGERCHDGCPQGSAGRLVRQVILHLGGQGAEHLAQARHYSCKRVCVCGGGGAQVCACGACGAWGAWGVKRTKVSKRARIKKERKAQGSPTHKPAAAPVRACSARAQRPCTACWAAQRLRSSLLRHQPHPWPCWLPAGQHHCWHSPSHCRSCPAPRRAGRRPARCCPCPPPYPHPHPHLPAAAHAR